MIYREMFGFSIQQSSTLKYLINEYENKSDKRKLQDLDKKNNQTYLKVFDKRTSGQFHMKTIKRFSFHLMKNTTIAEKYVCDKQTCWKKL